MTDPIEIVGSVYRQLLRAKAEAHSKMLTHPNLTFRYDQNKGCVSDLDCMWLYSKDKPVVTFEMKFGHVFITYHESLPTP